MIQNRENARIKHSNYLNVLNECSNTMDDVYENISHYSPRRKRKILIVFGDMIADVMTNRRFQVKSQNCLLGVEN